MSLPQNNSETLKKNIIYLTNVYPAPSNTFVRDEILQLEKTGYRIYRFSVRRFSGVIVDSLDLHEQNRTSYLLSGNYKTLVISFVREIFEQPLTLIRVARALFRLLLNSGGGIVRHAAYLMEAVHLRREADRLAVHHIHAHFSTNATAVAMLCKLLGGPSYSFTVHGPDEFKQPETNSFAEKIRSSQFVVAISDYCRDKLINLAADVDASATIHTIRCGVDVEQFSVSPLIKPENQSFVCVGRLCPQKGQIHIPEAVATLRGAFPGLHIVLVGDGESRRLIEDEIRAWNVSDQVTLMGWGSRAQVRAAISGARALVLPSYAEGLPVAIMEALAMGRPVISTRVAGIPELVDQSCGWLTDPGDVDGLVAAMRAALVASPEQLRELGLAGRRRVEQLHDRRNTAAALSKLMGGAA